MDLRRLKRMKNLYKEGLKQIRTLGFISLAIMTLLSIIIPVQHYLSALELNHNAVSGFKSGVSTLSGGFHLYLLFCIIAPIMVLVIFNFLNHRNSSDYYHSIPHKRTTLFASYFLAVITWVLIILITSVIISSALYMCFDNQLMFSIKDFILLGINIFAACLLVMALTALAMSITGTLVSNLIISLILIFVPRLFITAITTPIMDKFENIYNGLFPILNYKYNAVFQLLSDVLEYTSGISKNAISFSSTTVYTFIISIIFILIAAYLFKVRKSETAEKASQSSRIQKVFAIIIGLSFCLFPIISIFNEITLSKTNTYESIINPSGIFTIIVFYILCFFGMFLYEFITTFKIKSALKTFTFAPILLLLNFFVLTLMVLIFNYYKDYSPNPEKVDSVNIILDKDYSSFNDLSYENAKLYEIDFTNKDLIKLLTNADENYVNAKSEYFSGSSFVLYNKKLDVPNEINYSSDYIQALVRFNSPLSSNERIVYMDKKIYTKLISILENSSEYVTAYKTLPKISSTTDVYMNDGDIKSPTALYNTLKEELSDMDFSDFTKAILPNTEQNADKIISSISLNNYINGKYYNYEYPISIYTRKTLSKYISMLNTDSKNLELLKDIITNKKYSDTYANISVYDIDFTNEKVINNQYTYNEYNSIKNIDYLLDNLTSSSKLNEKSTLVSISINYSIKDLGYYKKFIFIANDSFENEILSSKAE